jgi:YbgC/YbaW family acyl-CoA thioester hydrolase
MFKHTGKINFYDCDPAGILFFSRIFNLCHSAYEAMIESFNLEDNFFENQEYVVPILKAEAHYHKSLRAGETVTTEIIVTNLKKSSFELTYFCKNDKSEECCIVKTVHVFVNRNTWKKAPMKEIIYKSFSMHLK